MELIEDTLKLSPLYVTLSKQEKKELVLELLASLGCMPEDNKEVTTQVFRLKAQG